MKKWKPFNTWTLYWKIKIIFRKKYNLDLKQEIHVIIRSKHSCILDFFPSIWKLKYIKQYYLPVVLYGCETCSLTLREESRLRVFENRILRRIFGPKGDENGEWGRLHNEELHSLYRSPNIARVIRSRRLRWAGHVARMDKGRSVFSRKETFRKGGPY